MSSTGLSRRRRNLWVVAAALTGGLIFFVAGALADAGNPINGTIRATAVDNGSTVTVSVKGEWNWLSHNSDCNDDRAGTGVGIIWSDPTEPGWTVSKNAITADIGIKTLRGVNDGANTIDREVHPVDIGNVPADGHGPLPGKAGQVLVDPAPNPVTGLGNAAAWRGGCGREPVDSISPLAASPTGATEVGNTVTLTSSDPNGFTGYLVGDTIKVVGVANNNYNGTFTVSAVLSNTQIRYTSGKINLAPSGGGTVENTTNANAGPCLEYCGDPWGSWGYQKTYSHTYEKIQSSGPNQGQSGLPSRVCVNFYDVHGNNAGQPVGGDPNAGEIVVDGNGDNSIETNSFNVNNGANCITLISPTLTTVATDAKVGDPIHDTATLGPVAGPNALPAATSGTITFELYGPRDAALNPNPDCSGPVVFTSTVNVTGPGDYGSGNYTPTLAGKYDWKVHYSGDSANLVLSADSACGAATTKEISTVDKLDSATATDIHNAQHQVVTAVEKGSTVHDLVTVTGQPGKPIPSGNVTVDWFLNGDCSGQPQANSGPIALDATGHVDATGFAFTVNNPGLRAFKGHYLGNAGVYNASDGPCEPLQVVDAQIDLSPLTAVNEVNHAHVITATVQQDDGRPAGAPGDAATGFGPAPDGTTVTFSLLNNTAGATFVGGTNTCTTTAGACSVSINTSTAGSVDIHATTTFSVGGVSLTRATGTGGLNSADANKRYVDAQIDLSPLTAVNEINHAHVITATVQQDDGLTAAQGGDGVTGFGPAPNGTTVTFSLLNNTAAAAFVGGVNTCTTTAGACSVSINTSTPGTVDIHATTTFTVGGQSLTRATGTGGLNSADANKRYVDANIQITPASAINPVSTNHVLTGHVNVNGGTGFANAPNGTLISFTIDSGPGSLSTPNPCTTAGGTGSCSVTLTSATPGTTVVSAHVTIVVGGVSLTRHTNGTASNSGAATKLFADDTVRTDILNAADGVVTSVVAGTIVHDKVFVAKTATTPAAVQNPTGSVIFHRYATIDCTGTATNQTVALTSGSPSTAVSDAFAPTANMSYAAEYVGDANYPARTGACEPLTVTPVPAPAIAIVKNPKSQTVAVGGTATFTITVTNAGNTVLTNVTVTDPLSPNCNRTSAQIPALASMAPGATVTYTCTRPNVRASFDNVATATGTPPSGPNVTASDTAPVKVQALTPAKKKVVKKKKPKVVSHKKPKATG